MIQRLLCMLGWHEWHYVGRLCVQKPNYEKLITVPGVAGFVCKRFHTTGCEKRKLELWYYVDLDSENQEDSDA
jgi:hypothetical protein